MSLIIQLAELFSFAIIAAGFFLLHHHQKHQSRYLTVAGWLLVVVGVVNVLGDAYYAYDYWQEYKRENVSIEG